MAEVGNSFKVSYLYNCGVLDKFTVDRDPDPFWKHNKAHKLL